MKKGDVKLWNCTEAQLLFNGKANSIHRSHRRGNAHSAGQDVGGQGEVFSARKVVEVRNDSFFYYILYMSF